MHIAKHTCGVKEERGELESSQNDVSRPCARHEGHIVRMEVEFHLFLISVMDGVWLTSRSSPFHPRKEVLAPSEWEVPRGAGRRM